jgi:hypothetical protein
MSFENQLSRMALALGMVGLERGWSTREAPSGSRAAGVRTFLGAAFVAFAAVVVFGWLALIITLTRVQS